MQAVILVGGFATRLRPLTDNRPKALLPILNKPMILHLVDKVKDIVDEVVLAVNYGKDHLEEYFQEHDCGVSVILHPEDEPLGTGGAIKNAEQYINDTFLAFNGDIITSMDIKNFIKFHREKGGLGALALWEVEDPTRFGIIAIDENNQITRFLEKPKPEEIFSHFINAGTYCLEPEILDVIPKDRKVSIEREIYPNVLDKKLFGLVFQGYWFDAGTPEIYIETQREMMKFHLADGSLSPEETTGAGSVIANSAEIASNVLIGKNCEIGENAMIGPNIFIGDNVKLGGNCRLSDAVIDSGTQVGSNVTGSQIILGRNNIVDSGLELPVGLVTGDEYKVDEEFLRKL